MGTFGLGLDGLERDFITETYKGFRTLTHREWDEPVMIWPHRDLFTGKWILPFQKVYRSRMKSPYGPVSVSYMEYVALWTTPSELIIQKLKGNA